MNKTAAFNFLSNISLGNNNNNNNNNNKPSGSSKSTSIPPPSPTSTSSTTTTTTETSPQLTISKFLSKPISKSNNDSTTVHSWIFNLPQPSYRTIDPKIGSKITLNIKQKHIILKTGDKFYFSISTPMKPDRIVSSSVVIGDPVQSKEDTTTTNVIVQIDKIFLEPVPRSIFGQYPILSDLISSKTSFTRVSEAQLPQFLEVITSFSTKTVKKEAINFLSGISLGDNNNKLNKIENSPSLTTTTPRNNQTDQNNVNTIPPISLNNQQQPPPQQPINNQQQPPSQQQDQQQLKDINTNTTVINTTNYIPSIPHQIPPPNQVKQVQQPLQQQNNINIPIQNNNAINNLNSNNDINNVNTSNNIASTSATTNNTAAITNITTTSNTTTAAIIPKKLNTIEEYNSNYNLQLNQRIFFVTPGSNYPISVFSMIKGESRKIQSKKSLSKREKDSLLAISGVDGLSHLQGHHDSLIHHHHGSKKISLKETSYAHILNSSYINCSLIGDEIDINGVPLKYNPTFLDNAELKTGKHRTVMNLPSYKVSIFPFIKKGAIKEELNEQFRQKHTWINSQTGITLYKIRKVKRKLKKISVLADLDISTLALSFVLLEKMIIKNQISKPNFKLYSACCLLLAAKFNDSKALESLSSLFETIEKKFSITKKELLAAEFLVFSLVSFGLFTDYHDVIPHLNQLKSELVDQIMPLVK